MSNANKSIESAITLCMQTNLNLGYMINNVKIKLTIVCCLKQNNSFKKQVFFVFFKVKV